MFFIQNLNLLYAVAFLDLYIAQNASEIFISIPCLIWGVPKELLDYILIKTYFQWPGEVKLLVIYYVTGSDEFELRFPELSRAELKSFRAELSQVGHFNFRAETKLDFFYV